MKRLKVPLYDCIFEIYIGDPLENIKKHKLPIATEHLPAPSDLALVVEYETTARTKEAKGLPTSRFAVFLRENASADTVAHEAVHVTGKIFKWIGAAADVENDEPFAYLLGWVVKQVSKALKDKDSNLD